MSNASVLLNLIFILYGIWNAAAFIFMIEELLSKNKKDKVIYLRLGIFVNLLSYYSAELGIMRALQGAYSSSYIILITTAVIRTIYCVVTIINYILFVGDNANEN